MASALVRHPAVMRLESGQTDRLFAEVVQQYALRHRVKPGITGWAQVHGRARLPWEERIELDVWYVEHRSPWLDLRILARTPRALFAGTYKGETGGWRA